MTDRQYTVLLVEDEVPFRAAISAYLEDSGFTTIHADNGQEGLAIMGKAKPDVVLTDLRMPVMDGIDFIGRMRSACPKTPIIIISGTTDMSYLDDATKLGVAAFFTKPIEDMGKLIEAIEKAASSPI